MRAGDGSIPVRAGDPMPPPPVERALITAYNPGSRAPVEVNRAAHRALRARLDAASVPWLPTRAHGTGPEPRRWDEPGFLLSGPGAIATALSLAQELGQNAILAAAPGEPCRLLAARPGFCGRRSGEPL